MSKAKPRIQKRLESSDRVSEVGVGFSNPSFAFGISGISVKSRVVVFTVVAVVPDVAVELVVAVVPVVAVILMVDSCKVEVIGKVVDIGAVVVIVVILVVVAPAVVVSKRFTLKYFREDFI